MVNEMDPVYWLGQLLLEDDCADIGSFDAHPGLHHYHVGLALMLIGELGSVALESAQMARMVEEALNNGY